MTPARREARNGPNEKSAADAALFFGCLRNGAARYAGNTPVDK